MILSGLMMRTTRLALVATVNVVAEAEADHVLVQLVAPAVGRLVMFSSGPENLHRVREVKSSLLPFRCALVT